MTRYRLIHGDCLDILPTLEAGSVDAIITDLPYQTTACEWDTIIPFEPMWEAVRHVLKPRGAFVTTASQPFTSKLIMSNLEWFKYELIWEKKTATGFLDCKFRPLKSHENILVFGASGVSNGSNPPMLYNPFSVTKTNKIKKNNVKYEGLHSNPSSEFFTTTGENYPKSVLQFNNETGLHPTQKPVALYEYLIRTYTNEGDTVLDFTMGSGTTGVAAMRTGRNFIGIELDAGYFAIAEERIKNAAGEIILTAKERATGQMGLFGGDV